MEPSPKQDLLRRIPSVDAVMENEIAAEWAERQPQRFVANCIRDAVSALREQILELPSGHFGPEIFGETSPSAS